MTHPDIFYEPPKGENSGLPHDPFKSFVIPRAIGWISTKGRDGRDNLGPYSQFTNVSFDPPTILFVGHQSVYKKRSKDSVVNCIETNEFVWNMATYDTKEAVNMSGLESWDDEFPIAGVTKAPSRIVKAPRVAESPVQFECKVHSVNRIVGNSLVGHSDIVIGRVVAIHIKGEYITAEGLFDVLKAKPLARLGYSQYTHIEHVYDQYMPFMPDDHVSGGVLRGMVGDIDPETVTQKTNAAKEKEEVPDGKPSVVHEEHPERPGVSFRTTYI